MLLLCTMTFHVSIMTDDSCFLQNAGQSDNDLRLISAKQNLLHNLNTRQRLSRNAYGMQHHCTYYSLDPCFKVPVQLSNLMHQLLGDPMQLTLLLLGNPCLVKTCLIEFIYFFPLHCHYWVLCLF